MFVNGSSEDKMLPANEMRGLIKIQVGLSESDTRGWPGVCRQWEFARVV